ncbi:hypothetical protein FIBSPDRAFT_891080 [Athelia psychrophila]|uniref:Uncharacterized protein n=1 Tax=Athelia psychrophila TaxID=1759441 RepID=A0A167UGM2_9AGAM|nr:hypothetical protein FIBSPDRAFT_904651 [Fibularhizoctonia sp. CBS 109695]KZP21619.1 hypothetical protein FIBSPDRAFT_891080 [Fibularhizoctonia sp. CBS 109695]
MHPYTQPTHHIHFVGGVSLDSKTTSHSRSWIFYQMIDRKSIRIGAKITIMRHHPLHQDNLDPSLSNSALYARGILLEGEVLGVRGARDGVVTFTITDDCNRVLTTIRVPASAMTISLKGGWEAGAIALRKKGAIIFYPMWIWAKDLQPPAMQRRPITA